MSDFTQQELQDLIDGGNDFTCAIATQCLRADTTIANIIEALLNANKRRPTLTLRKIHALIGVPFHER